MTCRVPRSSAIALGVAAFVSLSTLSAARADSSAEPAPTPSADGSNPRADNGSGAFA